MSYIPGSNTHTIGDLVPKVIADLQQRTDVATIAPGYIADALIEITESYPFEELRVTGPPVQVSVSENSAAAFLNGGDDYSSNEVFTIFIDPPANTVKDTLDYKTPKAIAIITSPVTQGIPKWWTRWGTKIRIAPVPNQTYTVFMDYQRLHPLPDDPNSLSSQQLMIPKSWEEIVSYAAAERISIVKRWSEQTTLIHTILYGDPEYQSSEGKRGRPGLIADRLFQVERDQRFNTRSLGIRVPRYTR